MNIHIDVPAHEMTDADLTFARDSLENALKTINAENTRRNAIRRAEAWKNVVKAINDYTAKFGDIKVETATSWWTLTNYETVGCFEAYD